MPQHFDLSSLTWQLSGYSPNSWMLNRSMELGLTMTPDVPAIPMRVPGSIQQALRHAGQIPDWEIGMNSRACEWVEHREWQLQTTLPDDWCAQPHLTTNNTQALADTIELHCDGLDGYGVVLCNHKTVGRFNNAFVPHVFDLTDALQPTDNQLTFIFENTIPQWQGTPGHTSRMTHCKPRFNYTWDWQPRLVQIGIWDRTTLHRLPTPPLIPPHTPPRSPLHSSPHTPTIASFQVYTTASSEQCGSLYWQLQLQHAASARVRITLQSEDGVAVYQQTTSWQHRPDTFERIDNLPIQLWWPAGLGDQTLYTVTCELLADEEHTKNSDKTTVFDHSERRVGFRSIEWRACKDAPTNADPWICVVNGRPVFLRGVNWTPIRGNFADVTTDMVRQRVGLYRDLNMNMLRVWGGAVLERQDFYEACDEMGLLVWQEFPLSSSAIDNSPPYDEPTIETMAKVARSYIARRQHHPSLIIWCGGNELQTADDEHKTEGIGRPWDDSHPMLARFKQIVEQHDPTRRYLPTSSTGPRFMADASEFGQGLHWDVHGPWNAPGEDENSSQQYWDNDDALFRSEIGCPGAADADLIRRYAGECATMPATLDNPLFRRVSWWIDSPALEIEQGRVPANLDEYVAWSQQRQAHYLCMAASSCLSRFPSCGGILFWMGHDAFPCPSNTAIVDFEGKAKPAALALRDLFADADRITPAPSPFQA